MRSQEPIMLYAIGLWPCFPPPCSPGALLKSPGRSVRPGPPQLAPPTWPGAAGWKSFWMVRRNPSPLGLSAEAGEGFFVCNLLLSSDVLSFPSGFYVFMFITVCSTSPLCGNLPCVPGRNVNTLSGTTCVSPYPVSGCRPIPDQPK